MCLVILTWIRNHIISLRATAIAAPFGINCDDGLARLWIFGGNHDDTIGTTGSIERITCRIFQYGNRCHIRWVDITPGTIIRRTIYHDQWILTCIDRADTANTDGRGRRWITRCIYHLHTSYLTIEGIYHIGYLAHGYFICIHYSRRTRERGFLLLAVCHNDYFIELAVLRVHVHLHARSSLHGLGIHTEITDHDCLALFYTWQTELTVNVGHSSCLRTFYQNLGTHYGISILIEDLSSNLSGRLCQHLPRSSQQQGSK